MEDGLSLIVKSLKAELEKLERERDDNIAYIYNHPGCGGDAASEWAEWEMAKEELLAGFPKEVVCLVLGDDYYADELDVCKELPF